MSVQVFSHTLCFLKESESVTISLFVSLSSIVTMFCRKLTKRGSVKFDFDLKHTITLS